VILRQPQNRDRPGRFDTDRAGLFAPMLRMDSLTAETLREGLNPPPIRETS
jgi:hypothetical protein